jgi:hypothetical protein
MPFRREPLHRRLAREAGLGEQPVDTGPRWGEVGIHGVARPREWDVVTTVDADLRGDEARFVALPGGEVVIEQGPDDVAPLADAVERSLSPPYRAEAVRRSDGAWAVAARRIRLVELPGAAGETIRLTRTAAGGRELEVDGTRAFGGVPALEELLEGDGVVTARRVDGDLWEVDLHRL